MLIFDMDGTLIDSNGIWRGVDEEFLAKRGYPYTEEYCAGVAHTIFPLAAEFTKQFCHLEESIEEIMAEWMEMAGDMYATRVPVKPGVVEYLKKCKADGEQMIVLTSSVPEHCHAALTKLDLMPYFERIFFANELMMEKTNPEIYKIVAEQMGVKVNNCTFFDDSIEACKAAKKAGMTVIGVHDPVFFQTEAEMQQVCDRYIMGFAELL